MPVYVWSFVSKIFVAEMKATVGLVRRPGEMLAYSRPGWIGCTRIVTKFALPLYAPIVTTPNQAAGETDRPGIKYKKR